MNFQDVVNVGAGSCRARSVNLTIEANLCNHGFVAGRFIGLAPVANPPPTGRSMPSGAPMHGGARRNELRRYKGTASVEDAHGAGRVHRRWQETRR